MSFMINVLVLEISPHNCIQIYDWFYNHFVKHGLKITRQSRFQLYIEVENKFRITFRSIDNYSSYKGLKAHIALSYDECTRLGCLIPHGDYNDLWRINTYDGLLKFVRDTINSEGESNEERSNN